MKQQERKSPINRLDTALKDVNVFAFRNCAGSKVSRGDWNYDYERLDSDGNVRRTAAEQQQFDKKLADYQKELGEIKKIQDKEERRKKERALLKKNWDVACMAWLPQSKAKFTAGKGLEGASYDAAIQEIERLKQMVLDKIQDLCAASFPDAIKGIPIAKRITDNAKRVTDAVQCFSSTVIKINNLVNSYVNELNKMIGWAAQQKQILDRLLTSAVKDLEYLCDKLQQMKDLNSPFWKQIEADAIISVVAHLNSSSPDYMAALKAISNLSGAIDEAIDLSYKTFDHGVSLAYQMRATFYNTADMLSRWSFLDALETRMKRNRNHAHTMRLKDDLLERWNSQNTAALRELGSYGFSLTNSGTWHQYSMIDTLRVLPKMQSFIDMYEETRDDMGIRDAIKNLTPALAKKVRDRESLEVSRGVFIDSREIPGHIVVDDTEFGLISCGLGPTVSPKVALVFDLIIDDGTTMVTAIARGGESAIGQYISYNRQDLEYEIIFPVHFDETVNDYVRYPDSAMMGDVVVDGETVSLYGYGSYDFKAWELIVSNEDQLSYVTVGDVFVYMNPCSLFYHGQKIWVDGDQRFIPYEYQIKAIKGKSVFVELIDDVTRWIRKGETLTSGPERFPYYKPLEFGMGGADSGGGDPWGKRATDFIKCGDNCLPMMIEHPKTRERTLYSSAHNFSSGGDAIYNMAVKEFNIKLTRMFGLMGPSEVPHALDSIKCKRWALYARFVGDVKEIRKLNLDKQDFKTVTDLFFLKAKWGFMPDG